MDQDKEDLIHLAEEAGIPRQIMNYLIDNQIIATINDLRCINSDEVQGLRTEYNQKVDELSDQEISWSFMIAC